MIFRVLFLIFFGAILLQGAKLRLFCRSCLSARVKCTDISVRNIGILARTRVYYTEVVQSCFQPSAIGAALPVVWIGLLCLLCLLGKIGGRPAPAAPEKSALA